MKNLLPYGNLFSIVLAAVGLSLVASCGAPTSEQSSNENNANSQQNANESYTNEQKSISIVNQSFNLPGTGTVPSNPALLQGFFSIISDSSSTSPDGSIINTGTAVTNNAGALVCYYNSTPILNGSPYNKLSWVWGKVAPPTPPKPVKSSDYSWWQTAQWLAALAQYSIDKAAYDADLLAYNNDLKDTTFYVPGTRLADGSLKSSNLTSAQLITACKNSMVYRGVFGSTKTDTSVYDSTKAQFLYYTESTRYYPSYPLATTDFDRPIIPTDVYTASVKNLLPTNFRNLVAFGDSLSDQGNILRRTQILKGLNIQVPNEPYWGGRFTNGLNWVDDLGLYLGLSVYNWAYGSAESSNVVNSGIPMSMAEQINDFITNKGVYKGVTAPYIYGGYGDFSHTLFSVLIGGNNYFDYAGIDYPGSGKLIYNNHTSLTGPTTTQLDDAFVDRTVGDIKAAIDSLYSVGARYFIVGYLPDLGKVPTGSIDFIQKASGYDSVTATTIHNRLSYVIASHNAKLKQMLMTNYAGKGVTFITLDMAGLIYDVANNPANYQNTLSASMDIANPCYNNFMPVSQLLSVAGVSSFTNLFTMAGKNTDLYTSNYYLKDPNSPLCNNPEDYLFWDTIHPTTRIHNMMGYGLANFLKAKYPRS